LDGEATYEANILIRTANPRSLKGWHVAAPGGRKLYAALNWGDYFYACIGYGFVRVQRTAA
jgi:hypothetical protein